MTEVSWTRQFLGVLDSRPIVLQSDHVEDPRKYPARGAYILPKMANSMSKPSKPTAPGQERSVTVSVKSLRNPPLDLTLPSQSLSTSIHELKTTVAGKIGVSPDRVRVLLNKKPCSDSKALKDLVGSDDTQIEFSVMVIGGVPAPAPAKEDAKSSSKEDIESASVGVSGLAAAKTAEFWLDLEGFLTQRLKDDAEGKRLLDLFKKAFEASDL